MAKITRWADYFDGREAGEITEGSKELEALKQHDDGEACGEIMGGDDVVLGDDYKKLLDFLKGKPNVKATPPKEAPKGWFVVDEASGRVWLRDTWVNDPSQFNEAILKEESAAQTLAKYIGGIVIPVEEILS